MKLERYRQQFGPDDAPGWLAIDAHLAQVRKAHWNRPDPSTLVEILEIATGLYAVQAKKSRGNELLKNVIAKANGYPDNP